MIKRAVFFSVGDRGNRHKSQSLKTHSVKLSEFIGMEGVPKTILLKLRGIRGSVLCTRNAQATTFDPVSGDLYEQGMVLGWR